jgi:hypothetical protein
MERVEPMTVPPEVTDRTAPEAGTAGPSEVRALDPTVQEDFTREDVLEGWETTPPGSIVDEPARPLDRRSWIPQGSELDRQVRLLVDEKVRAALASSPSTPAEERLRFAELRIDMMERERLLLQRLVDRSTDRPPAPRTDGRTGGNLKTSPPKEYSPKSNTGPSKWLFQMEMFFEYASVPEEDKVRHAMIQLKDAAEAWWRSHILETTDSQGLPTADRLTAWADFSNRLKQVFTPVPEMKLARNRLYDLRQTGSVQMYTQAFREITFILDDLSAKEALSLYERGLQPRILQEIYLKEPANLEEMISMAEKVDALRPGVGHAGPSRPAVQSAGGRTAGRRFVRRAPAARLNTVQTMATNVAEPPDGFLVAAVRPPPRRPPARGPRPPANGPPPVNDRNRLRRKGRCFVCEQTGHLARECPQGNGPRR